MLGERKNVEIDLSPFGKLKGLGSEVIFTPPVKKQQAIHGKQTVKALIDMTAEGPAAGETEKGKEIAAEGIEEIKDETMGMSSPQGIEKSIRPVGMGETSMNSTLFKSIQASGTSPTRRFKKPEGEGKVSGSMLSAGVDPLAVSHEYSLLVKDTTKLMKTYFKKPPNAPARLPPVLDTFSRTVAAPITSQKHYTSVCHKIASHYTANSRGLYVDPETRTIKYKSLDEEGTKLNMMSRSFVEPATTEEEYLAVVKQDASLKFKVDARKKAYERYKAIEDEIENKVVAPINNVWLAKITDKIPAGNLPPERMNEMFQSMAAEVNKEYYLSSKKSILDYVLKNVRERERLGLPISFYPAIDYGSKPFIGIEPSSEWRNNAVMAAIKMRDTLCVFNRATLELMKLWKDYENLLFVDLPNEFEFKFIDGFVRDQKNKMDAVKSMLGKDWHSKTIEIVKAELDNIPENPEELRKSFYEAISTLMSNQVRWIIEKSVVAYQQFFMKFKKSKYASASEVVARKYDAKTPIELSFLQLTLDADNEKGAVKFKDPLHEVQAQLKNVIEEVVKSSHNLPRAEHGFNSQEVTQLWKVSLDDQIVKRAQDSVENITEENLNVVKQVLKIYEKYEYLLSEKVKLDRFLQDKTKTREDYQAVIEKYQKQKDDIIESLPCEVRMNMFLIDCREINNKLMGCCDELIAYIQQTISTDLKDRADKMLEEYDNIQKRLGQKIETEEILIDTEKFLANLRDVKKEEFQNRYNDLLGWLMMLLNTTFNVTDQELRKIKAVLDGMKVLSGTIDRTEESLRSDHIEFEKKLDATKTNIGNQLESLTKELDKFKERDIERSEGKLNTEILLELGKLLKKTKDEINDTNNKETILNIPVTEYQKIPQLEDTFNNFDKLWNLAGQATTTIKDWGKANIFDLSAEVVEKDCNDMLKLAGALYGKLYKLYPKPAKVASGLREKMNAFNKKIDLIGAICNKDLQDRHWKLMCEVLKLDIKRESKLCLNELEDHEIMKNKERMDRLKDISQRASQEASNEKSLVDMIALWDQQLFVTKDWKKTGTFVLSGANIEELLILQEEHLLKTQTMKGSQFAEFIRPRIVEWEQWLDKFAKCMDEWKKLQASWTSLESVFTSEDILQQLPQEGGYFKEVDRAWRTLMDKTHKEEKVKIIIATDKLKEILTDCNSKLERVNKRLNDYLETKRLAFPRFFFLGNEQLLIILSDAKEPTKVQEHIGNCFDGIGLLDFDPDKKIKGMIAKEKEKVDFVKIVDPSRSKGLVEMWLLEVEEQMMLSIKDICEKALNDYPKTSRDKWVMGRQGQAILCIAMLYWTKDNEDSMIAEGTLGLKKAHDRQQILVNYRFIIFFIYYFLSN